MVQRANTSTPTRVIVWDIDGPLLPYAETPIDTPLADILHSCSNKATCENYVVSYRLASHEECCAPPLKQIMCRESVCAVERDHWYARAADGRLVCPPSLFSAAIMGSTAYSDAKKQAVQEISLRHPGASIAFVEDTAENLDAAKEFTSLSILIPQGRTATQRQLDALRRHMLKGSAAAGDDQPGAVSTDTKGTGNCATTQFSPL